MNRVDCLMGYLRLFQSRGLMRAQDFAARLEISERTVYRDIQVLSEVGVPIISNFFLIFLTLDFNSPLLH